MGPSSTRAGTPGGGRKTSTQPSPLCAVAERSSLRVAFAPNTPPPLAMYPGYGESYDELCYLSVAPIAVAVAVVVAAAAAVVVVVAAAAVVVVVVVAADVAAAEVDAL